MRRSDVERAVAEALEETYGYPSRRSRPTFEAAVQAATDRIMALQGVGKRCAEAAI